MSPSPLAAAIERAFAEGRAEEGLLLVATVASGARLGLDAGAGWTLVPDDGRRPERFDEARAHVFAEVIETPRRRFDADLEAGAEALGLPGVDASLSFPSVAVIRSVLAKEHPYMTRLALEWIAPTELRELRPEIQAVAASKTAPTSLRDLAQRLTVPA